MNVKVKPLAKIYLVHMTVIVIMVTKVMVNNNPIKTSELNDKTSLMIHIYIESSMTDICRGGWNRDCTKCDDIDESMMVQTHVLVF